MALLAVVLLGLIGLAKMPLSFLPSNSEPRLFARIDITRTSPEVLERDVIRPIEEEIAGIRDLERIQVGSGSWGVRVNLDFEPGTDIEARKLELRDRIERVRPELPDFVQGISIGAYTNFDDPMMELRLSSGTDLSQDYYLIEERIVRRIERIEGVARVELEGVAPHELEVAVDLESASRGGVALDDLGQAVRDARQGRSLGVLRNDNSTAGVRSPNEPADPERFERIPLRRAEVPVEIADAEATPTGDVHFAQLGEVADVRERPEDVRRLRRLNGRSAINLEVFAQAGASAVEVSERIKEEIGEIAHDPALDGIELLIEEDQGAVILDTLRDLRNTGIYGGLLGIAVLFLFLHRVTTTFAASVSVPLSVLGAGAVLFLRGDELNCIVMLGLVLGVGMLIDNAVVIVEAIVQHAQKGEPPLRAARLGAREVGFATIASTLSTIIVFIPLVATESSDHTMMYLRPLGITFAIGLVASLFISQTAVPLIMGRVLRPRAKKLNHPILSRVASGYASLIGVTLRHPRIVLVLGLAMAASAVYPFTQMQLKLGQRSEQADSLPIRLQVAGSRSFEQIGELVIVTEAALLERKAEIGFDSVSCSYSDHWGNCRIYPSAPFQDEDDVEAFQARVVRVLPEQPGVTYRLGERDFDWHENTDRNVVEFAIKGEDMGKLNELAEEVATHLRTTLAKGDPDAPDAGGYDTITTPFDEGSRELHVRLEGDRLRRLGLTPDDVATRVSLAFQGLPLGTIRGERGDLKLRLSAGENDEEIGAGMAMLRDLRVPLATGEEVTLGSISSIEFARRPFWIQRVDRQTEARIKARFLQADPEGNFETVSAAMSEFSFPPGYSWGRTTRWKNEQQANSDMLINLGLCLLLVYAVMASLFESFLQPLGILVTCLLGCFGAPWLLWLSDTTLDTTAVVGMFILIGVVVNNGIMLVDKVTQLRAGGMPRDEALQHAGRDRIRPILMTMTTTVLGLLPMLVHHPTLAGVYYHAIAIVIAGGLLTSTFMTLVFLPAAYTLIEGVSQSASLSWRSVLGRRKS
jgi:HAE1 family hydrophobic/amphiphilic exporter-1